MRYFSMTVLGMAAALSMAIAAPAAAQTAKPAKAAAKTATVATHSTSGVVKSINDTTLVLTPSKKGGKEMTFAVNSTTQKDAGLAAGSNVTVRYHMDGGSMVATAVTERKTASTATSKTSTTKKS